MKRITLVKEAAYMAIAAHGNQTYDGHPYYYHLEQVVDVLKEFGYTEDKYVISGYLHDADEDGNLTYQKIKRKFGEEIAEIVYCVTDENGRTRKEKKKKTLPKTAGNRDAIIVKLADRIANCRGGKKNDMYVEEYQEFQEFLRFDGHATELWEELDKIMVK